MLKGARKHEFSPELEALLREAYRAADKRALSQRLRRLMQLRPDWPAWVWFNEAARMGLQGEIGRRRWSAAEDRELMLALGSETVASLAARIGRTRKAVYLRAEKLRVSTRVRDGLSACGLAEGFGVGEATVARWIRDGWLTQIEGRISEEAAALFAREYPNAYDLRRVDQVWFKSLLTVRVRRCRA